MTDYENAPIFVAVFRDHPLGPNRYVKDFWRNLTISNKAWWEKADEAALQRHFEWALNHHQYHYSTSNLDDADSWKPDVDKMDAADLAILEKYAPIDLVEVELRTTEKDANGWQRVYWVLKESV